MKILNLFILFTALINITKSDLAFANEKRAMNPIFNVIKKQVNMGFVSERSQNKYENCRFDRHDGAVVNGINLELSSGDKNTTISSALSDYSPVTVTLSHTQPELLLAMGLQSTLQLKYYKESGALYGHRYTESINGLTQFSGISAAATVTNFIAGTQAFGLLIEIHEKGYYRRHFSGEPPFGYVSCGLEL